MLHVELLSYTPEPDRLVAAAAKLCYAKSDIDTLLEKQTPEKVTEFLKLLEDLGHQSPVEHVSFTFGIEGVSRALLAQITRHRIASYSVQSQRYVEKSGFDYIVPPEIAGIPEAAAEFKTAMAEASSHYENLRRMLIDKYALEGRSAKEAEKKANEDARFVLPNACDTRIIMTMNARSLMNFFKLRCCRRAQWEIRGLAFKMLGLVRSVSPILFANAGPSCLHGKCTEGIYSCGEPYKDGDVIF